MQDDLEPHDLDQRLAKLIDPETAVVFESVDEDLLERNLVSVDQLQRVKLIAAKGTLYWTTDYPFLDQIGKPLKLEAASFSRSEAVLILTYKKENRQEIHWCHGDDTLIWLRCHRNYLRHPAMMQRVPVDERPFQEDEFLDIVRKTANLTSSNDKPEELVAKGCLALLENFPFFVIGGAHKTTGTSQRSASHSMHITVAVSIFTLKDEMFSRNLKTALASRLPGLKKGRLGSTMHVYIAKPPSNVKPKALDKSRKWFLQSKEKHSDGSPVPSISFCWTNVDGTRVFISAAEVADAVLDVWEPRAPEPIAKTDNLSASQLPGRQRSSLLNSWDGFGLPECSLSESQLCRLIVSHGSDWSIAYGNLCSLCKKALGRAYDKNTVRDIIRNGQRIHMSQDSQGNETCCLKLRILVRTLILDAGGSIRASLLGNRVKDQLGSNYSRETLRAELEDALDDGTILSDGFLGEYSYHLPDDSLVTSMRAKRVMGLVQESEGSLLLSLLGIRLQKLLGPVYSNFIFRLHLTAAITVGGLKRIDSGWSAKLVLE